MEICIYFQPRNNYGHFNHAIHLLRLYFHMRQGETILIIKIADPTRI